MRIAWLVRLLMVDAVRRDPENRAAFQSQSSADGEEVLEGLRNVIRTMRMQPVIAQADPEANRHPVNGHGDKHDLPTEHEERGDCAYVKQSKNNSADPIRPVVPMQCDNLVTHGCSL